jgi:hypothetical protein
MNIKKYRIVTVVIILFLIIIAPLSTADCSDKGSTQMKKQSSNEYEEIISYIWGVYTDFKVNRGFVLRDVTITAYIGLDYLEISGLRWENDRFLPDMYQEQVEWVHAPRFLGFCHQIFHHTRVVGLAFGDIEYKSI